MFLGIVLAVGNAKNSHSYTELLSLSNWSWSVKSAYPFSSKIYSAPTLFLLTTFGFLVGLTGRVVHKLLVMTRILTYGQISVGWQQVVMVIMWFLRKKGSSLLVETETNRQKSANSTILVVSVLCRHRTWRTMSRTPNSFWQKMITVCETPANKATSNPYLEQNGKQPHCGQLTVMVSLNL